MRLLVIGTLAFDSVETPFGKRDDIFGGSAGYLATAAAYFCDVCMVGVIGSDFPQEHLDFLKSRNIDIDGVQTLDGKTFRWRGNYMHDLNVAHTLETQLNVLESFDPKLPETYQDAEIIVLGNFDPILQRRVLEQLSGPKLVALDTMNFWIEGSNDELRKTLSKVDLISVNDGEARQLSGEYNLIKAAEIIRKMGPKVVIVKRGEHGATIFTEDTVFMAPAYPILSLQDPTGAGDSFAGGMMGYLAKKGKWDSETLRKAVITGSVLASYVVEDFSLDRFRSLSNDDIQKRFAAFRKLTEFDPEF